MRSTLSRDAPLAYTTVMTVMNRLAAKNVLARDGERRRYLYEATAADAAGLAVRDVLRAHGDAAVAHFVDEARADPGRAAPAAGSARGGRMRLDQANRSFLAFVSVASLFGATVCSAECSAASRCR